MTYISVSLWLEIAQSDLNQPMRARPGSGPMREENSGPRPPGLSPVSDRFIRFIETSDGGAIETAEAMMVRTI